MQAEYDNVTTLVPTPVDAAWIAPVGQARAHSSHAVHRLKSMTGNPNEAGVPSGLGSVMTPVLRLSRRMPSI
jgi:hypothetical protein